MVDPRRSAAARRGWETRRRNMAQKSGNTQPKPKAKTRAKSEPSELSQVMREGADLYYARDAKKRELARLQDQRKRLRRSHVGYSMNTLGVEMRRIDDRERTLKAEISADTKRLATLEKRARALGAK